MTSTGVPIGFTSGSSAFLESTRTNVVVIQDLENLCWRRYTLQPTGYGLSKNTQQQNALLSAFTDSIKAGYAATVIHRSSRSGTQSPHFGSSAEPQMDLCVFWNQKHHQTSSSHHQNSTLEMPANLTNILNQLQQAKVLEEGCWDKGMSYAVRCLLMKATNCLVQAQLAQGGYYRIGRYFVKTAEANQQQQQNSSKYAVAFSLNYFVHSDGRQLCAFVNARRRPPLQTLTAKRIVAKPEQTNVILCPYGLSGHLTGRALVGDESKEFLQLFAHTCPVVPQQTEQTNLPSVVEVAIAGGAVHTFYPVHSLLVVAESNGDDCKKIGNDDAIPHFQQHVVPNNITPKARCSQCSNATPSLSSLDLMSSGNDISTHPSVLPSPNCSCSFALTGKRSSKELSHSTKESSSQVNGQGAKKPTFHRSTHLEVEETVPSSLQREISLLQQQQQQQQQNQVETAENVLPSANVSSTFVADQFRQQNDGGGVSSRPGSGMNRLSTSGLAGAATATTATENVTSSNSAIRIASNEDNTSAHQPKCEGAASASFPNQNQNCASSLQNFAFPPVVNQDVLPRKCWPSSHERTMLSQAVKRLNNGFIFKKKPLQSHVLRNQLNNTSAFAVAS